MANLNQDQTAAAQRFFDFMLDENATEFVIQGSAGTGKTHLVNHIINELPKQNRALKALGLKGWSFKDIYVTATTRKAARILGDVLACEPITIHSLLGLKVHNDRATGKTKLTLTRGADIVSHSLIFIDEASFVDTTLLHKIRERTNRCKIIYIGDQFQLLPTNDADCPVFSGTLPTVTLNQIMRHQGKIEQLSAQFKESVYTRVFKQIEPDQSAVKHVSTDEYLQMLSDAYTDPDYAPEKVKVVAWTNSRVHEYNDHLRTLKGFPSGVLTKGEMVVTNRPIMDANGQTKIATDGTARITRVSEPDMEKDCDGVWVTLDHSIELFVPTNPAQVKAKLKALAANKEWSPYFDIQERWGDLRPPYACTVHKSQGSTYETVFVDLNDIGRCNQPTTVARMLYVAISRASKQVVLHGELPLKYQGATNVQLSA